MTTSDSANEAGPHGLQERVLVVSIDGVTPRSITRTTMPTLCDLARQGAGCFRTRTVEPPLTLPAHASMLLGVDPSEHGLLTNSSRASQRVAPSFLKVARNAGRTTAAFFSWRAFESIIEPDAASVRFLLDSGYECSDDRALINALTEHLRASPSDVTFVYLSEPDLVAHDSPTSVVERPLGPGELVIFDNRRVLHGRSSFRGGSGRHLQGCYVDMDA
ncbi:MAG: alkaline phosphatase family protein, partial [Acidimicrobiales bacterium]